MMRVIIRSCIALLFTAFLSQAATQNLYTNGGFENSGTGWTLWTDPSGGAAATVSYPATGAQEGTRFCRVTVTAINASNNWHVQLQDPAFNAVKGIDYHLSFWAKADAPRTFQVAVAGDSASPYAYRQGFEMTLGTAWKKYEVYRKSDVAGSGQMSFNFYCGYSTGTFDFDNVVLEVNTATLPGTITIPAQSAWQSGNHRNLFAEMGYSQTAIDEKVDAAFQQLFFGDRDNEAVYTPVGSDLGFINKPGSGSIITEGQSYGMMISVMMNRQDIFDRLWKFAYTYMQHRTGDQKGTFSWKVNETSPYAMVDPNPAPDGEEYFVTALLFATKRWGNGAGIMNYQVQADSILYEMLHKTPNTTVVPMINPDHSMIVFTPDARSEAFTDPSYHLPGFYRVWAQFATNDKPYWAKMADSSWAFLKRACHSTTGLVTDYANFDGTPKTVSFNQFAGVYHSDSWRMPMNVGFGYSWFKDDPWAITQTVRLLRFFDREGDYKQTYTWDGQRSPEADGSFYSASGGQIACNAVSALASNDTTAWKYVDKFWKTPVPSGTWRYYSGLLHMMSLLHCSGKFIIYGNPNVGVMESLARGHSWQSVTLQGMVGIIDISGRVVAQYDAGLGRSFQVRDGAQEFGRSSIRLPAGVYFARGQSMNGPAAVKKIVFMR
ncbi:MAG: carbohydrate binding domain-containing protein [Chitinispirillaceae bacterium]|nr:carbohydrate binding domain-containing protein [Chitinispirillaceae bacterium]